MVERYDLSNPDHLAVVKEMLHSEKEWANFAAGEEMNRIDRWDANWLSKIAEQAGECGFSVEGESLRFVRTASGEPATFTAYPPTHQFAGLLEQPQYRSPIFIPNEDDLSREEINSITGEL